MEENKKKQLFDDINKYWNWLLNIIYTDIYPNEITFNKIDKYFDDVDNIYLNMHFENMINILRVIFFLKGLKTTHNNTKYLLYHKIMDKRDMFEFHEYITTNNDIMEKYYFDIYSMINIKKISLMGKTYKYTFENMNNDIFKVSL